MGQIWNQLFREHRVTLPCWLCLLYSLVNPFDFRLIAARVTGGEAVALFGLVLLLPQFAKVNFRPLLVPVCMVVLYAFGVIACDLYNDNYMQLFMRGIAKPMFIGMIMLFFYVCFSLAPRSILFYLYALPIAVLVFLVRAPKDVLDEGYITEYNRFVTQFGPILITWARLGGAVIYAKSKLLAGAVYAVLFVFLALFSSRSDALLAFMVGGIFVLLAFIKDPQRARIRITTGKIVLIGIVGLMFMSLFYGAYVYGAPRGMFGEMQREKFVKQSQTQFGASPVGLVLSGRTESVALLLAGADRPIFGLGSWPILTDYYYEASAYSGDSRAIKMLLDSGGGGRSSGHSAVLGGWVTAGILGLCFWLYLAYIVYRIFLKIVQDETLLTPWFLPACIFFYWHWAFSPIGTGARQGAGIMLATYAAFLATNSIPSVRARFYRECRLPGRRMIGGRGEGN
jgi:hypothetical protein